MINASPPVPLPASRIFVGIDVGKESHYAGFVSQSLLLQHRRFERCPSLKIKNSREDFERLLTAMKAYGSLDSIAVIMERTGHYHQALLDYLLERGICCYTMHVQERLLTEMKTDKLDSLSLANLLYNQVCLGVQAIDKIQQAQLHIAPSATSSTLSHLVRHRYELTQEMTRHKNKLIAICDQLFPEFTQVFADPNGDTALNIREAFPSAAAIASAPLDALKSCRTWRRPSTKDLMRLQELARTSIGCCDEARLRGLRFEQQQLITELRTLSTHLDTLDAEISEVLADSREGKILMSIDGIAGVHAAQILASVGCIGNFEKKSHLRKFFGWSPSKAQSGSSLNQDKKSKSGKRLMKQAMWLVASTAVSHDTEWQHLYERLLPRMCRYNAEKQDWIGKNRVITRIASQIVGLIFVLLRRDYDLLASLPPGETPPEPMLYDRERHRAALNKQRRV